MKALWNCYGKGAAAAAVLALALGFVGLKGAHAASGLFPYSLQLSDREGPLLESALFPERQEIHLTLQNGFYLRPVQYTLPGAGNAHLNIVRHQVAQRLSAGWWLGPKWVVGVAVPWTVWLDGAPEVGGAVKTTPVVGDPTLAVRYALLNRADQPLKLALSAAVRLPLAQALDDEQIFHGDPQGSADVALLATRRVGIFQLDANLGARVRRDTRIDIVVDGVSYRLANVGTAALAGFGASLPLNAFAPGGAAEGAAVNGAAARGMGRLFVQGHAVVQPGNKTAAVHTLAGVVLPFGQRWSASLAAGPAFGNALVAPPFTAFASVSYRLGEDAQPKETKKKESEPAAPVAAPAAADSDGDGVPDVGDFCPTQAEDKNGHEDGDGCPDADADQDRVLDVEDSCPRAPGPFPGGCPVHVRLDMEASRIFLLHPIHFDTGRATVSDAASLQLLQEVVDILRVNPDIRLFRIEGHADERGSRQANQKLSAQRTIGIAEWLVKKGIAVDRLEAYACGINRPTETSGGDNTAARVKRWSEDRRVEFHVIDPAPATGVHVSEGCVALMMRRAAQQGKDLSRAVESP